MLGKEVLIGTVLYKTKSLDGTKPNTNPETNPNPIQLFYAFFEHRPMIPCWTLSPFKHGTLADAGLVDCQVKLRNAGLIAAV